MAKLNYEIVELDLSVESELEKVNHLLSKTFANGNLNPSKLVRNTQSFAEKQSLYLAAKFEDKIIGFNAFIAHTFIKEGKSACAYQSCWSATDKAYRGQRIFQTIIEKAQELLTERSAQFIFGFPNIKSYPIFVHKLNFISQDARSVRIPNVNLLYKLMTQPFNYKPINFIQKENEVLKRKKFEFDAAIIEEKINETNLIWGKIQEIEKLKLKFRVFLVGGLQLNSRENFLKLIARLREKHSFHFLQVMFNATNNYAPLFKNKKLNSKYKYIYYPISKKFENNNVDLFNGITDVF